MLVLLSPAKSLDFEHPHPEIPISRPAFALEAEAIARGAARLGAKRLQALMGISDALAKLNAERFRAFADAPERPAVFAFNGDVYRGLSARSLSPDALAFADAHLRILSGLYGLLRPLDAIRPYRLEMGTGWAPGRAKDLYAYWRETLPRHLAQEAEAEGSGDVLNLASNEYWHAIGQSPPAGLRIVSVDFRERTAAGLRFNSFAAKHARGLMARWICQQGCGSLDELPGFDLGGWRHDPDASEPDRLHFVRAVG